MSNRIFYFILLFVITIAIQACSDGTTDQESVQSANGTLPMANGLTIASIYGQVSLSWNNPVSTPVGNPLQFIKVFRKTGDANFDPGGSGIPDPSYLLATFDYTQTTPPLVGTYVDEGNLVDNTAYSYAIYAQYSTLLYSAAVIRTVTTPSILKLASTNPPDDASTPPSFSHPAIGSISLTFSDKLDPQALTLDPNQLSLATSVGNSAVTISSAAYDSVNAKTINYGLPLLNLHSSYLATFNANIKSVFGAPLENNHQYSWTFTSADGVWGNSKLLDAKNAVLDDEIQVQSDQNNNVLMVWRETPGKLVSRYGDFATVWEPNTPTVFVTSDVTTISKYQLVMNRKGEAVVGWLEHDPTGTLKDNLFVRKFIPASGAGSIASWDSGGFARIQDGSSNTNSASVDVQNFTLGINEDGDVIIVWYASDATTQLLVNTYFIFATDIARNSGNFGIAHYPAPPAQAPSRMNLVMNERINTTDSGIARCQMLLPGTSTIWTNYSVFFDPANISTAYVTNTPLLETFVGDNPMNVGNHHNLVWSTWVETNSTPTITSYNIVVNPFETFNNVSGAKTVLATMNNPPLGEISMAESEASDDVIVSWTDSQGIYMAYYNATAKAWQVNSNDVNLPYAFRISNQSAVKGLDSIIDSANNVHIVWGDSTNVYALRKSHLQNMEQWLIAGLPQALSLSNSASTTFTTGTPMLTQNQRGESLLFWVGGGSGAFANYNVFTDPAPL